jgi:hypothetical protein
MKQNTTCLILCFVVIDNVHVMSPIQTRPADSQLKRTTGTICCIYTQLPPDDGHLASMKHVEL